MGISRGLFIGFDVWSAMYHLIPVYFYFYFLIYNQPQEFFFQYRIEQLQSRKLRDCSITLFDDLSTFGVTKGLSY
jgi:hypothetical protein